MKLEHAARIRIDLARRCYVRALGYLFAGDIAASRVNEWCGDNHAAHARGHLDLLERVSDLEQHEQTELAPFLK